MAEPLRLLDRQLAPQAGWPIPLTLAGAIAALPVWQGISNVTFPYAGPQAASVRDVTGINQSAAVNRSLVGYLESHQAGEEYLLATLDAKIASPLILETDKPIMAIGGYSGKDPILDGDRFAAMIQQGTVRHVLLAYDQRRKTSPRKFGSSSIGEWVVSACIEVPSAAWQGPRILLNAGTAGIQDSGTAYPRKGLALFDCGEATAAFPASEPLTPIPPADGSPRHPWSEDPGAAIERMQDWIDKISAEYVGG